MGWPEDFTLIKKVRNSLINNFINVSNFLNKVTKYVNGLIKSISS